jgi:hypothetical protein
MENPFRKFIFHLVVLICPTKPAPQMPSVGIHLPISRHRSYQHEPRRAPCVPCPPPPLFFRKFVLRCSVQPTSTMPTPPPKSSSSLDADALGDHLADSLGQITIPIKGYLQDMVVLRIFVVGRDIIGIHIDGTSCTIQSRSIAFTRVKF